MRRAAWAAALLWAASGCSGKDRLLAVDGLPSTAQALDFGTISVGTAQTLELELVDHGRAPVTINGVEIESRGRVFAAQAQATTVAAAGGRTRIRVTFHPETEGPFGDKLVIRTDSAEVPLLRVALRGLSGPAAITFDPPRLDFGGMETGDERGLDVTVHNPTDLPLTLVPFASPGELALSAGTAQPNGDTHLTVFFRAGVVGNRTTLVTATPCATCTAARLPGRADALRSAIAMEPDPLSWSAVPVHRTADAKAKLHNLSWRPVSVTNLSVDGEDFTVLSGPGGQVIQPGQSAPVELRFAPQHAGPTHRQLDVAYHSFADRAGQGTLVGLGGGPQIAVAPMSLDFGDLPVGGKARLQLNVQNAGLEEALVLTSVTGADTPFSAHLPVVASVAPGAAAIQVAVDFAPIVPGTFSGVLHIQSNDPATPILDIPVAGSAHAAGPCAFKLTPIKLDFGNVPPGSGAVLGFRFEDTGSHECAVKDIQLSSTSDPAFFMPGGALVGGDLFPTDAFSAQVAFKSPGPGEFHGDLVLTVNDPLRPHPHIPIIARSQQSCLVAEPPFIDIGPVRLDCSAHDGSTLVTNACVNPVTITGVDIGEGTLPEFSLVDPPSVPMPLAPGATFNLTAHYARSELGQQYAPLFVKADSDAQPLLIPLLAETLHVGQQFDRFLQGSGTEADVLFVVSNTTTMAEYQQRLAAAVGDLLDNAAAQGVDLHVGVTSAGMSSVSGGACPGGAAGGEAGRLVPVDGSRPRIVTLNQANALAVLQQNVRVGDCQTLQQGLEAVRLALSPPLVDHADDPRTPAPSDGNAGFLRPEARLVVVVVSDEDDHSGFDPAVYVQFLKSLKGLGDGHRVALDAIVPLGGSCTTAGPPGPRFAQVANDTGGSVFDICENDYGQMLDALSTRGIGLQTVFPLSSVPDAAGVTVLLNGAPANGSDWYYDPNLNAVVFNPGFIPPPGTQIEVDYTSSCN
ncbi:MAG: choice-of-anchor D domain-containing protein [Deltaproteobacteria bacterium]|nr:choice-of-anchor D domain-containing protein [Deltaproteobacteria bacterium]